MLVTADKTLNLTDFGVAEEFDTFSNQPMKTSRFAGTHQFLSPEITSGQDNYDGEKVDVWAAGVTLYNMVTGHYPFESKGDSNIMELYEKITACQLKLPPDMDPLLANLLQGMLAKDPQERMAVSQVLGHAWTQSQFLRIQHSFTMPEQSAQSILSSFTSTTMMPYLEQLFKEEIENEIQILGKYSYSDVSLEPKRKSLLKKIFSKRE